MCRVGVAMGWAIFCLVLSPADCGAGTIFIKNSSFHLQEQPEAAGCEQGRVSLVHGSSTPNLGQCGIRPRTVLACWGNN